MMTIYEPEGRRLLQLMLACRVPMRPDGEAALKRMVPDLFAGGHSQQPEAIDVDG
jgi:hypothetical protein